MNESNKLLSKYHINLLSFSNGNILNESNSFRDELRNLRIQAYMFMKSNLEKLIPQFDQ